MELGTNHGIGGGIGGSNTIGTADLPERRRMVSIPHAELESMLALAATRGARQALADVGLEGTDAANDIRELRNLLDAFTEAKKTAALTLVKMLVTGLVMALLAGTVIKMKLFGGGQ